MSSIAKPVDFDEGLLDNLTNYPQAVITRRFAQERVLRIYFLERKVEESRAAVEHARAKLKNSRRNGEGTPDDACKQFDEAMDRLNNSLRAHAIAIHEDSRIARTATADNYYMNRFRNWHHQLGNSISALNGKPASFYGKEGDPVDDEFISLVESDLGFLERLIIDRLIYPFNYYVVYQLQIFWSCIFGRRDRNRTKQKESTMTSTMNGISRTLVCLFANLSLSVAIVILDRVTPMKYRLVVMILFGLLFSLGGVLLGKAATPAYTLNAAYFAAMVIFLGTTTDIGSH